MDSSTASVHCTASLPELRDVFPGYTNHEELYKFSIQEVKLTVPILLACSTHNRAALSQYANLLVVFLFFNCICCSISCRVYKNYNQEV